jgi:murein hydrolase activator
VEGVSARRRSVTGHVGAAFNPASRMRGPGIAATIAVGILAFATIATAQAPETESATDRVRREESLKNLEQAIQAASESRGRLDREIAELKGDRAKLNQALIDAAAGAQATEARMAATEARLAGLDASESGLRRSLEARRGLIGEVLAALQRMGRRPPPAVLVRPEDVLAAVRTSMLLGALVPELRGEVDTLAADLGELVRLKGLIAEERETLRRDIAGWAAERARLGALMEARQGRIGEAERQAVAERERVAALANEARSLRELIDRMEGEIGAARRAAEEAKRAAEAQAQAMRDRFAAAARDPARLSPKLPFAETRGVLPLPASGQVVRAFGAPDGSGGTTRGVALGTRPRAIVTAPSDGWVSFAGPFRSYGRLLILNAGDGYYLLLAGMDQINVEVGQFVLAGEPVAVMGTGPSASPPPGLPATSDPVLYVEFRKDGGSIDPGPWWAKGPSEKVRG